MLCIKISSGDGNTAFGHFAYHAIASTVDDNTALGNASYYSGTAGSHGVGLIILVLGLIQHLLQLL